MVEIVKQDYEYNKYLYNEKKEEIKTKIGNFFPINHVGSTAIPKIYGKNIIDILIGVNNVLEMNQVTNILKELGYFAGENSTGNIYRFFANTKEETKSGDIHLHLVNIESDRYRDFLILKEYLLSNPEEAKKYSDIKKEITKQENVQRKDYKSLKSEYVDNLLKRARKFTEEMK